MNNINSLIIISLFALTPITLAKSNKVFSIETISTLPPIGKKIANRIVGQLKKKKFATQKINDELNIILNSLEKSSKYHFMKIARECAKDSFLYCNQNLSENRLQQIAASGLQFTVTMECVKKNFNKYSEPCKKSLLKNQVVQTTN
jgi:hypothetical protein